MADLDPEYLASVDRALADLDLGDEPAIAPEPVPAPPLVPIDSNVLHEMSKFRQSAGVSLPSALATHADDAPDVTDIQKAKVASVLKKHKLTMDALPSGFWSWPRPEREAALDKIVEPYKPAKPVAPIKPAGFIGRTREEHERLLARERQKRCRARKKALPPPAITEGADKLLVGLEPFKPLTGTERNRRWISNMSEAERDEFRKKDRERKLKKAKKVPIHDEMSVTLTSPRDRHFRDEMSVTPEPVRDEIPIPEGRSAIWGMF